MLTAPPAKSPLRTSAGAASTCSCATASGEIECGSPNPRNEAPIVEIGVLAPIDQVAGVTRILSADPDVADWGARLA